jgi:integrase/recombinase XerD
LSSSGIMSIVAKAMARAGVQSPSHGAHVLRHSLACDLLRRGASLETIGALLRHRSVETTTIYAKVDVGLLGEVAQPWPEGSPC